MACSIVLYPVSVSVCVGRYLLQYRTVGSFVLLELTLELWHIISSCQGIQNVCLHRGYQSIACWLQFELLYNPDMKVFLYFMSLAILVLLISDTSVTD